MDIANRACEELSLIGWPLPWEMHRDSTDKLRFALARPGEAYEVLLKLKDKELTLIRHQWGWQEVMVGFYYL